jgi:WD40 repeat protein
MNQRFVRCPAFRRSALHLSPVLGACRGLGPRLRRWLGCILFGGWAAGLSAFAASAANFAAVAGVFGEHCLDCHNSQEADGKLVLETFESLMSGGESGPVVVPGKSSESLLIQLVEGTREDKDGKKRFMPPGKRKKLDAPAIAQLRAWIDAGAKAPTEPIVARPPVRMPDIAPKGQARRPVTALAYEPKAGLIAVGRYGEVELLSAESRQAARVLRGHRGQVTALVFSRNGEHLFTAGGAVGEAGEIRHWRRADGELLRVFAGHQDAVYALALSPDGSLLASGSYDQRIELWSIETGARVRTLAGHNGAVFDLAFRADGRVLASASADRTVKLWDVASGARRDTLSQALKEVQALVFSPDGKRLLAGSADNRIRLWEISDTAAETTNPLLTTKFAHEGGVLRLAISPDGKRLVSTSDDRSVKLWDSSDLTERGSLEPQPDWPSAVAFTLDGRVLVVGRQDGSLGYYDAVAAKPAPLASPTLSRLEPRGLQRGLTQRVRLIGKSLAGITEVKTGSDRLKAVILPATEGRSDERFVEITAQPETQRDGFELWVVGPGGESGKVKVYVDDLPHLYEAATTNAVQIQRLDQVNRICWGALDPPGNVDEVVFEAEAGQTIVCDVAAKSLGSKASVRLTLLGPDGAVLASSGGFDGGLDPLLALRLTHGGGHRLRLEDAMAAGSAEHFYRLAVGTFPFVTGHYPLGLRVGSEIDLEWIGYNLEPLGKQRVGAAAAGDVELRIPHEPARARRAFKVVAAEAPEHLEHEPNDTVENANAMPAPGVANGRIWNVAAAANADSDLFRFDSKPGERWVIETQAAQRGSPMDTRIEILGADGTPVPRVLLQAVRDSQVTFRGIDSLTTDCRVENWEEMELNQLLYLQGEVVRLFRAPQGPDSGFLFYSSNGKRRTYFDTSAVAHALDEPCYIVEPHPPGARALANGLPRFTIVYANDDDGERRLGTDSRVHFDAPAAGPYLVRVSDSRRLGGDRFVYRLIVRRAQPDFSVSISGMPASVPRGSGQGFAVNAERRDGFDGEIRVAFTNLPSGFAITTPLVIEAGHSSASGTIFAEPDAVEPAETVATNVQVNASASIDGRAVVKPVSGFGPLRLGEKPTLYVQLEPSPADPGAAGHGQPANASGQHPAPLEIVLAPGRTVPAALRVVRQGHEDLVTFTVENLPHGVIVDNIGLNGVLIPKDQSERGVFLRAARWVAETDRWCYAVESQAGRQTSRPVLLRVRRSEAARASAASSSSAVGR